MALFCKEHGFILLQPQGALGQRRAPCKKNFLQCGAKAVYVSGAGSTVMAVAERTDAAAFYAGLEQGLERLEGLDGCEAFTLLQLDADNTGATVE